jgi:hypothetical protein
MQKGTKLYADFGLTGVEKGIKWVGSSNSLQLILAS